MTWLQTYTGKAVSLIEPKPEQIDLEDIAHSLSLQCRFNGHVSQFYSIAEHSILVQMALLSRGESKKVQRIGLMHDAAEAYVGDLVAPIKRLPGLSVYRALETAIWTEAIAPRFGLPDRIPDVVKRADLCMLVQEARELLGEPPEPWGLPDWAYTEQEPEPIVGALPAAAKNHFLLSCRLLGIE